MVALMAEFGYPESKIQITNHERWRAGLAVIDRTPEHATYVLAVLGLAVEGDDGLFHSVGDGNGPGWLHYHDLEPSSDAASR